MAMLTWAPEDKVIKGCIACAIWWLLAVFPAFPLLPIGRTAGSLVGAALMVLFGVISPDDAFKAVDLPILGLLFATMVISVYLERARMFDHLGKALSWRTKGGTDLLCRVCLLAAVSSAIFTNDSTCVVLTGFVLKLCREKNLNPKPFLIALACSANIGSAATPIGNPQNLVIAVSGKLGFVQFVLGILPAVLVGLALNMAGLLLVYGRSLSLKETVTISYEDDEGAILNDTSSSSCSSSRTSVSDDSYSSKDEDEEIALLSKNKRSQSFNLACPGQKVENFGLKFLLKFLIEHLRNKSKILFFLLFLAVWIGGGMLQVFEAGVGLPWTAITVSLVLTVVDFSDATETLDKVSYSILVFFAGMFITVEGFNRTGAPAQFWRAVEPYSRIDTKGGEVILSIVVTFLSNVASNVPTVLLLGPKVAASAVATSGASPEKAWLILAWVSTVAGNLTLVGSAANIIVCEKARCEPEISYDLTFWDHLKYGFFSTLVIIIVGLPWIGLL
ncbi:hypothetical protein M758_1G315900 [Ceratodon purpureus]|nr:hypothetical protein M758_1G315900 [Ceratodon purpureus]